MSYKGVIFDLDGTLADTLEDLADATNYALEKFGRKPHRPDSYRQFVGKGLTNMVIATLGGEEGQIVNDVLKAMKQKYCQIYLNKTKLYDGISEMIQQLKSLGIKMAILTNKDQSMARQIVSHLLGDNIFEDVVGTTGTEPVKPNGTAAKSIMGKFGLASNEVVFIGDSNVDMQTAENAGINAVGVSWGFRGRDELIHSGADKIIDKPAEILDFF